MRRILKNQSGNQRIYRHGFHTEKFSEDCYFYGEVKDKDEILDIICRNAIEKYKG